MKKQVGFFVIEEPFVFHLFWNQPILQNRELFRAEVCAVLERNTFFEWFPFPRVSRGLHVTKIIDDDALGGKDCHGEAGKNTKAPQARYSLRGLSVSGYDDRTPPTNLSHLPSLRAEFFINICCYFRFQPQDLENNCNPLQLLFPNLTPYYH